MEQITSPATCAAATGGPTPPSSEQVNLALKGSRQLACDWQVDTGLVSFSGDLAESFASIALDCRQPQSISAFAALLHEEDRSPLPCQLRALLNGDLAGVGFFCIEMRLRDARLGWRWVEIRANVVERAPDGRPLRLAGTLSDIHERKRAEESLRRLAYYDGLTSLPNRFLFREYLQMALKAGQRSGRGFALLFVDLDSFKQINDSLGHAAGDQALQLAASRLASALRASDKIARIGGDEFCILIEDEQEDAHVAAIAKKLLEAVSGPFQVAGTRCEMSASIGISMFPRDGNDGSSLLRQSDCAMYRAKRRGKNCYCFHRAASVRSAAGLSMAIAGSAPATPLERG